MNIADFRDELMEENEDRCHICNVKEGGRVTIKAYCVPNSNPSFVAGEVLVLCQPCQERMDAECLT